MRNKGERDYLDMQRESLGTSQNYYPTKSEELIKMRKKENWECATILVLCFNPPAVDIDSRMFLHPLM